MGDRTMDFLSIERAVFLCLFLRKFLLKETVQTITHMDNRGGSVYVPLFIWNPWCFLKFQACISNVL